MNDVDIYYALMNGGVLYWEGYPIAVDRASADGVLWENLHEEAQLHYLMQAGVESWRFYSEAMKEYIEEHS